MFAPKPDTCESAQGWTPASVPTKPVSMSKYYSPDLGANPEDPFARDADGKLVRRSYWLGMSDQSVVLAMTQGVGAHIPNDQKRAHLEDIGRGSLIDDVCVQEVLPPE